MNKLTYKKIASLEQYNEYCNIHEKLFTEDEDKFSAEIDLLEILIADFDRRIQRDKTQELNPVELLRSIMEESNFSQKELAESLNISKQLLNDILKYRRGISKSLVIKLSAYFSMSQEAFSRAYPLDDVLKPAQMSKKGENKRSAIEKSNLEVYQGPDSKYFFRLQAPNGRLIAESQGYKSKKDLEDDVDSLVKTGVFKSKMIEILHKSS